MLHGSGPIAERRGNLSPEESDRAAQVERLVEARKDAVVPGRF
jgi:hypothetical protein